MRPISLAITLLLAGTAIYWFVLRQPAEDMAAQPAAPANAVTATAEADLNLPVPVMVLDSRAQPTVDQLVLRGRTVAVRNVSVTAETTGLVISQPLRKGATVAEHDSSAVSIPAPARPSFWKPRRGWPRRWSNPMPPPPSAARVSPPRPPEPPARHSSRRRRPR